MVRKVSYFQRTRIIAIFLNHQLNSTRGRFHKLKRLASNEEIFASERTMRRIVKQWQATGSIADR